MAKAGAPDWDTGDEGRSDFASSDDEPAYELERIIAQREVDGANQYLVKWMNFGDEDCTWEPSDSFDQSLSISLWEEARGRGDTLDETELQDVERKMARRQANNQKEEAARQERGKKELVSSPVVSHTSEGTCVTKKPNLTNKGAATSLPRIMTTTMKVDPPPILTKRKAASPIRPALEAEPQNQKQDFHGLREKPQTARRTKGTQMNNSPDSRAGRLFRNLSHQNNAQKNRRQEPAPNMSQLSTLRPATELAPQHDVALNLPSGPRALPIARNVSQETLVESSDGRLEQVPNPDINGVGCRRSASDSNGPRTARPKPVRYEQISHPVFHSAPQRNAGILFMRYENEYMRYKFGELVVHMYVGTRPIGHVKVVGLTRPGEESSALIAAVLKTKIGTVLRMTFEQEDANYLEDYSQFEGDVTAVGSLEPYDNAKDGFYDLLTFFMTHRNVACVWRHGSVPWIMVSYSSRAAAFEEKGYPSVSGGLAFVVCRRVPWRSAPIANPQLQAPPGRDGTHVSENNEIDPFGISTAMETDSGSIAVPQADVPRKSRGGSTIDLEPTSPVTQISKATSSLDPRRARTTKETSVATKDTHVAKNSPTTAKDTFVAKEQHASKDTRIAEPTFEEKYGMNYEKLKRVPPTIKTSLTNGKFNCSNPTFFLAFDEDRKDEEAELKRWLGTRTQIYCNQANDAWDRFKEALKDGDHTGIILLHEDYVNTAFSFMTGMAKRIRREDIQIFRVSLGRPLYNLPNQHFERIFPSGFILLITESIILANPKRIAALFKWFIRSSKRKMNWRLFLRPQPEQYLRDICETNVSEEDRSSYLQCLVHLKALQKPPQNITSPLASPDDDSEPPSYILAPLSLCIYSKGDEGASLVTGNTKKIAERDRKLLDFFAGWTCRQISSFRRFVAVTEHLSEDLKKRSSHVEFLELAAFEKEHIGKLGASKVTTPAESPMSPMVKSAVVKQP